MQRDFTRKIHGTYGLNYWERLRKFNLFSLQRRRERYQIIYVWKILEKIVPNVGIEDRISTRTMRTCIVPAIKRDAPKKIQTLRESSFTVHGTRLFNCIPRCLRDMSGQSVSVFKRNLDRFLRLVPDEPLIPGYTAMRRADSNSLLDLKGVFNNIAFEVEIPDIEDGVNQM